MHGKGKSLKNSDEYTRKGKNMANIREIVGDYRPYKRLGYRYIVVATDEIGTFCEPFKTAREAIQQAEFIREGFTMEIDYYPAEDDFPIGVLYVH